MARPLKAGLDYFPLDTDFFNDDKIQFVSARFDEKGELISAKLLCRIYKNGYYLVWNDDTALLFAKAAGKNITPGLVNDVVQELLKRDFFNMDLYKRFSVLTSNGIQKRYFEAIGRRKEIEIWRDVLLIDEKLINANINSINVNNNSENVDNNSQSKVKENKVNKSKVNNELSLDFISPDYLEIFNKWLEYKKSRKQSYKDVGSIELCYKGLLKKSNNNPALAKIIVERSMENNWAGLFELPPQELNKMNISPINVNQNATAQDYTTLN